jgi:outer membrane protein
MHDAGAQQPLTLAECYRLALKRSEEVAIRSEQINEAEARFLQAFSGVMPKASFVLSETRQDGSGSSAFTLDRLSERRFTVSQPLFGGFKEFAAMSGSRAERRQRHFEREQAEQLLYTDVANAFYLLREQREELAALEMIRNALVSRIDELAGREELGRSRPSEVVSAEAQLRSTEAEIELVRGRETASRQLLEFLTGTPRIIGIIDPEPGLPQPRPERDYLIKVNGRPDVQAAESAWKVAERGITVAKADFWPDVDLEGSYYTERTGAAADVEWDALLMVDVPLFQGGSTVGAVRQAKSQARQAQLRYEQVQREAVLDVQDLHARLQQAISRQTALTKAHEASAENYRLLVDEYRLSLINNLDVLQALEQLQESRRELIRATYDVKRLYHGLQAATGEQPA